MNKTNSSLCTLYICIWYNFLLTNSIVKFQHRRERERIAVNFSFFLNCVAVCWKLSVAFNTKAPVQRVEQSQRRFNDLWKYEMAFLFRRRQVNVPECKTSCKAKLFLFPFFFLELNLFFFCCLSKPVCLVFSLPLMSYLLNRPVTSITATLNFLPSRLPFSGLFTLGNMLSNSTERFVEFHEPT